MIASVETINQRTDTVGCKKSRKQKTDREQSAALVAYNIFNGIARCQVGVFGKYIFDKVEQLRLEICNRYVWNKCKQEYDSGEQGKKKTEGNRYSAVSNT